jgi:transcriptional regulator with XRE-family HTH domain
MSPTTSPSVTTGHTLRRARELAGMRDRAAARSLGVRRSRLRDWESGAVVPDADELERAIQLYSADLNEIWPDRQPLVSDAEPGVLVVGDERIDVRTDPTITADGVTTVDNRVVLTRYLAAVRRQRGLAATDPVELRANDIASLATVLDLEDADLESELAELLDLTPAGARWTTRAMVVGALMAVGATAMVGTSWFSSTDTAGATTVEAVAPAAASITFAPESTPTTEVSEQATVQFAPAEVDPDAPVEAVIVPADASTTPSPFSTEPSAAPVELAPAVFAVAPSSEWSPVVDDTNATTTVDAPELTPAPAADAAATTTVVDAAVVERTAELPPA